MNRDEEELCLPRLARSGGWEQQKGERHGEWEEASLRVRADTVSISGTRDVKCKYTKDHAN